MRRLALPLAAAAVVLVVQCLAPVAAPAAPPLRGASTNYLSLANKGIRDARLNWWNAGERWYNDRLGDQDAFPLATDWSVVPLFEAIDGVAIADPSKSKRKDVRSFALFAERYWNPDLR